MKKDLTVSSLLQFLFCHPDCLGDSCRDSVGVFAACHGECRMSAAAALDQFAGRAHQCRGIDFVCQIRADGNGQDRFAVAHAA